MKERVVHVGFGKICYMINESYDKFSSAPFTLLYRNESVNDLLEIDHWTEVYEVDWNYIEEIYLPSINIISR